MKKLCVDKWLVVQSLYSNEVVSGLKIQFSINVSVHLRSVFSLLFFVLVLEALLKDFKIGVCGSYCMLMI